MPTTAYWKEQDHDCSRRQFSLTVAYALTIHKAQGITVDKALETVKELQNTLSYVALSRVRRIEDLIIDSSFNDTRINNIQKMQNVIKREEYLGSLARHLSL